MAIEKKASDRNLGLDMVRSVAILLVMISHYTASITSWLGVTPPHGVFFAGDLGVDLFFGLSGFLIGGILIDIVARDPSWRNLLVFLLRRWMRTLPVYWLCLLALALLFPPAAHLGNYLAHFATMTQNLAQPMPSDYWFAVSWSLTIEEWFYLLFGISTIVSARLIRRPWAIWLPLLVFLIVPLTLRLSVPAFADWSNGLTKVVPFRLDEIAYGVVMAWLYYRKSWIFRNPLPFLLLGIAIIGAVWLPQWTGLPANLFWPYVTLQYNATILGCVLCIPAALRIRSAPAWLAIAARTVSRLSYTLYLIHLTILVDAVQGWWWVHKISTAAAMPLAIALPFVIAELVSRCIEQPIMRRRPRQWPKTPTLSEAPHLALDVPRNGALGSEGGAV